MGFTVSPDALKHLRRLKNLKQKDVADELGKRLNIKVPLSTYANKESKGDFTEIEITLLGQILGEHPDYFVVGTPEYVSKRNREQKEERRILYNEDREITIESMLTVLLRTNAEILANQKGEPFHKVFTEIIENLDNEIKSRKADTGLMAPPGTRGTETLNPRKQKTNNP